MPPPPLPCPDLGGGVVAVGVGVGAADRGGRVELRERRERGAAPPLRLRQHPSPPPNLGGEGRELEGNERERGG